MTNQFQTILAQLRNCGWSVNVLPAPLPLPESLRSRYPWIPDDVATFFSELGHACRGDEKFWLLTALDYRGESDSAFAWNEWEVQSIEAARGDVDWINQIHKFWDNHLPIALSVSDDYAYMAL